VINPFRIDVSKFGQVEDRTEASFNISNISKEDLNISLVYMPEGYFEITLPDKVEAGKSAEATVKVIGDYIDQEFEKSVTFELSDTNKTRFTVPIRRIIRSPQTPATHTTGSEETGGAGN
jgi:hypothetical protein